MRVMLRDHVEHAKTRRGGGTERLVRPSEVTNKKVHHPAVIKSQNVL